ncbi:MAG: DNA polymerase III subunit delta [Treponema sp.]|nr:DNA polymerase III subunit delta [Treponema sp.]
MNKSVFLFTGPELGEKADAINSLKNDLKKSYGAVDEHSFYLHETPFSQVMTILQSGTLFSNGVFVVCKEAELLKTKDETELLKDWISNPTESAVLVLVSDSVKVDKKIDDLIPSSNKKIFWELFEEKKVFWLQNFFSKNGYSIDGEAIDLILEMVENNTLALKNECQRFFVIFPKEHRITEQDVESVLVNNREDTVFTLFNEIADSSASPDRRFERGLEILHKLMAESENYSVSIILPFSSCFRKLIAWHKICPDGYAADTIELKKNGISGTTMQKIYKKASKIWTVGQTTAVLAVLGQTDIELRSGGSLLKDVLLEKMLYEIVVKKGASIQNARYD